MSHDAVIEELQSFDSTGKNLPHPLYYLLVILNNVDEWYECALINKTMLMNDMSVH